MSTEFSARTPRQCCACGQVARTVRNIVMLPFRRPPGPGEGWGCVICGLPAEGAIAMICDACTQTKPLAIRWMITGCVTDYELVPLPPPEARVPFVHDEQAHAGEDGWLQ